MKKLKKIKGVKTLKKNEQKMFIGGNSNWPNSGCITVADCTTPSPGEPAACVNGICIYAWVD